MATIESLHAEQRLLKERLQEIEKEIERVRSQDIPRLLVAKLQAEIDKIRPVRVENTILEVKGVVRNLSIRCEPLGILDNRFDNLCFDRGPAAEIDISFNAMLKAV